MELLDLLLSFSRNVTAIKGSELGSKKLQIHGLLILQI